MDTDTAKVTIGTNIDRVILVNERHEREYMQVCWALRVIPKQMD